MKTSRLAVPAVILACAGAASAQTRTETFENFTNEAGWRMGGQEGIVSTGGNPDSYLHTSELDVAIVRTFSQDGLSSSFTGNYAERNVTRMGLDVIVHNVDFSADGRPMTLILCNNMGTVDNVEDDLCVYLVGEEIPGEGQPWKTITFNVPGQSATLPAGWHITTFGPTNLTDDQIWDLVIHDVDYVWWNWHDPDFFAIFQMWEVGVDNIFITEGTTGCYANCDGSTNEPVLNVLDFNCFLNAFNAGASYANCDGSTNEPVLNVLDFNCFLNRFNNGCP